MSVKRNIIYGLCDPRNGELRYVGKSSWGIVRAKAKHSGYCGNWIKSLKWPPQIVILEDLGGCAGEDLNEAEKFQIAYWRFLGARLTNLTSGGEGISDFSHSVSARARMSKAKIGKKWTEAHKAAIAASMLGNTRTLGYKHSKEHNARISAARMGHPVSEETRRKTSSALKGRKFSDAHRAALSISEKAQYAKRRAISLAASRKALGGRLRTCR